MIPKLSTHMTKWKRYADDTRTYIKLSSIDYVLSVFNYFHRNVKFNIKEKKDKTFLF